MNLGYFGSCWYWTNVVEKWIQPILVRPQLWIVSRSWDSIAINFTARYCLCSGFGPCHRINNIKNAIEQSARRLDMSLSYRLAIPWTKSVQMLFCMIGIICFNQLIGLIDQNMFGVSVCHDGLLHSNWHLDKALSINKIYVASEYDIMGIFAIAEWLLLR